MQVDKLIQRTLLQKDYRYRFLINSPDISLEDKTKPTDVFFHHDENAPGSSKSSWIGYLKHKYLAIKNLKQNNLGLLEAVKDQNLDQVKTFIENGADVNIVGYMNKNTPLLFSVLSNLVDIVEYLLEKGADPNLKNINGDNTLILALKKNKTNLVELLISKGANPFSRGSFGSSALCHAVALGKVDYVKLFLTLVTDSKECKRELSRALDLAISRKFNEIKGLLLKCGASEKTMDHVSAGYLLQAIEKEDYNSAKKLLDRDVSTEARDKRGRTSLQRSIINPGDFDLTKLLLAYNADIEARDIEDYTPLMTAIIYSKGCVELLLENNANPNAICNGQSIFLHTINRYIGYISDVSGKNDSSVRKIRKIQEIYFRVLDLLARYGADVNVRYANGHVPLHVAIHRNDTPLAEHLLEIGASKEITDSKGNTPLMLALKKNDMNLDLIPSLLPHFGTQESENIMISLLNKPLSYSKHLMNAIEYLMDNHEELQGSHTNESEFLLLLRHPENRERDVAKTAPFTRGITSIYRYSKPISDTAVKTWSDIGLLTHAFRYWLYDTKFKDSSIFCKYGFKSIPDRETDKIYGNGFILNDEIKPFVLSSDKTLIEFRRGYLLASRPGIGTVVIRNSSFHFGRDLFQHTAYSSKVHLTETDLQTFDPKKDKRFTTHILDPILYQKYKVDKKIASLVDELMAVKEDYRRWKFDSGASEANQFTGHLSPGLIHIIDFLRYLKFEERPLPDLAFVNPDYPIIQPYKFEDKSGMIQDRFVITDERLTELANFVEYERDEIFDSWEPQWTEEKYPDSDWIRFLSQAGVENQGELVLIKPESQTSKGEK